MQTLVYAGDLAAALAGLLLARLVWLQWLAGSPMDISFSVSQLLTSNMFLPPGMLLLVFWAFALSSEGLYDPLRMTSSVRVLRALSRAAAGVTVLTIIVQFLVSNRVYSRGLLLLYVGITFVLLALWRVSFFRLQQYLPLTSRVARQRVVIFGTGADAKLLSERMARHAGHLYEVAGFLTAGEGADEPMVSPVLGSAQDLVSVVNAHDVRVGIIASRAVTRSEALGVARTAGQLGIKVLQIPFTFGLVSARVEPASLGVVELVQLGTLRYPSAGEQIKRAFDIAAVVCGGVFVLPIGLLTSLLIKLGDGGPILYAGPRAGLGGRAFPFYKFRSMVVNADKLRAALEAQNEADGRLFKMQNDPRITRVGHFIRKWSIDELPQLLNVLKGDMNLVGPRPLPLSDLVGIEDDPEYAYWFEQRSKVRPGITGLWQVSGRSDLGFTDMVDLDVYYVQNWSLFLDLQILWKTIPAVLARRGAH